MGNVTRAERDELLQRVDQLAEQMYGPEGTQLPTDELRALREERDRALELYLHGLPRLPVGRCPFCGEKVTLAVDTFGLDGLWWDVDGPELPPRACPHFLVLLGAVNFQGHTPTEAAPRSIDEICPGPEVPYLVPRLLELPNSKCTVFSIPIASGKYTAYLMAYFADPPAPPAQRQQAWLRGQFTYCDSQGELVWNARNDPWDFDLESWLRHAPGKVAWIAPDDSELRLQGSTDGCPYLAVSGRRKSLGIRQGCIHEYAPPDGTPFGADVFDA